MARVRRDWQNEWAPWSQILLTSLGELSGKRVLLLGNGSSCKELYFAQLGANVILTDLSIKAVMHMQREYQASELDRSGRGTVAFHAVDALHLPFPDKTFDIIYGAAFVHHLNDMDAFLGEVYRCLKDGGICRFIDQADSPVWSALKCTILHPLRMYSHWRWPRSPEDQRNFLGGRFNRKALEAAQRHHQFSRLFFHKEWFFLRLSVRHYGLHVRWNHRAMERARLFFRMMKKLDQLLYRFRWMKRNALLLIWGFTK